jgi:hypothetical protein
MRTQSVAFSLVVALLGKEREIQLNRRLAQLSLVSRAEGMSNSKSKKRAFLRDSIEMQ